jgi:hypothetical protein
MPHGDIVSRSFAKKKALLHVRDLDDAKKSGNRIDRHLGSRVRNTASTADIFGLPTRVRDCQRRYA